MGSRTKRDIARKARAKECVDYDEAMKSWFQVALMFLCVQSAWAQSVTPSTAPQDRPAAQKSALDAMLFYQLLLGEMNVRGGSPGSGFSIILDAARKTRDPLVFQRAVDVALQSRSGDAALQAAQAWKSAIPESTEANRYLLQILLALNRLDEAAQALSVSIRELPANERTTAIASIPRVFARVQDKKLAADTVEKALQAALRQAPTAASAWTTLGRMRRDAGQLALAVEATRQALLADATASGPMMLALSLVSAAPTELWPLIHQAMRGPVPPELRLGYARLLIGQLSYTQALEQLEKINTDEPTFADAWWVHGLLLMETGQWQMAEQKLLKHVGLVPTLQDKGASAGLAESLMALAQIAQRKGQWTQAQQWLAQVPADADPIKLASRQADLLSQQGRLDEARLTLERIRANTPELVIRKALVQSQWLRDNKQAANAYALVKKTLTQHPQNTELMSELAMVSEKLKRYDEMEALLRELMKRKPDDPHAFNALGYSLADRNIRLPEARELIVRALQLAPNDAYIQDSLGWVAFRQGNLAEALQLLQTAYKAKPDAEIAAHLGEVLWVMGQRDAAAVVWREGLLLKPDNETLAETLKRFQFKP